MITTKRAYFQSRRKAAAGAALIISGLFAGFASVAAPVGAVVSPAVFPAGYDTYLKAEHRGVTAESKDNAETCPDLPGSGETAWHFVLDGSTHDFLTLDVAFTISAVPVTLLGLTPKAISDPTFSAALNFAPTPDGKHAYVFTANTGTVLDAAAQVTPDAILDDFQLSHTCVGTGTTTTTTTAPTTTTTAPTTTTTAPTTTTTEGVTTTTEGVTTTTEGVTTTTDEVLGTVVARPGETPTTKPGKVLGAELNRSLPRTGAASTLPLGQAALVLIGIGIALLGAARVRVAER